MSKLWASGLRFLSIAVLKSDHWNYHQFDSWPLECRLGKSQSPIAICTQDAVKHCLPPFKFTNYDTPLIAFIENTGTTVVIKFEKDDPSIRGSLLKSEYTLENIHFHWPSDHTIDGIRYALEAHFVHYKTKAGNLETALNFKDGVVVFAVMFEISDEPNEVINEIIQKIKEIACQFDQPWQLDCPIAPSSLLPKITDTYYTYRGSLTTPNCNESVLWFVFPNNVDITRTQLDNLSEIYTRDGELLLKNNRPLQDINGREVFFTTGMHRQKGDCCKRKGSHRKR